MFHPLCFLIVSFIYIVPLFIFVLEQSNTCRSISSHDEWTQSKCEIIATVQCLETDPDIATTSKLSTKEVLRSLQLGVRSTKEVLRSLHSLRRRQRYGRRKVTRRTTGFATVVRSADKFRFPTERSVRIGLRLVTVYELYGIRKQPLSAVDSWKLAPSVPSHFVKFDKFRHFVFQLVYLFCLFFAPLRHPSWPDPRSVRPQVTSLASRAIEHPCLTVPH